MGHMRRAVTIAILVATASLCPFMQSVATAATKEDVVTVGLSLSVKLCCSPGKAVGFGPAVNYAHWLSASSPTVGGFGWLHYYPKLGSARLGLGPQASYLFGGLEAGPSLLFG